MSLSQIHRSLSGGRSLWTRAREALLTADTNRPADSPAALDSPNVTPLCDLQPLPIRSARSQPSVRGDVIRVRGSSGCWFFSKPFFFFKYTHTYKNIYIYIYKYIYIQGDVGQRISNASVCSSAAEGPPGRHGEALCLNRRVSWL